MKMRNTEFGNIFTASGTLNFFGEGWQPFHSRNKRLFGNRFNFSGSTFIAKTTTLLQRIGNMPLDENNQPVVSITAKKIKRLFRETLKLRFLEIQSLIAPDCIKVDFFRSLVLNSVSLSGPGAAALLDSGKWQKRKEPFGISFMSLGETLEDNLREACIFVAMLKRALPEFQAPVFLQVNVSCPNTRHLTSGTTRRALAILKVFQELGIPVDLKIGVVDALGVGVDFIRKIEASGLCDCLTCSNTILWGQLPDWIDWRGFFGSAKSPLDYLGGGGLSGAPLMPVVLYWLDKVRQAGITMPIKAGGGILRVQDVRDYKRAGASALEIGCIVILRPWRVSSVINEANRLFGGLQ